MNSHHQGRDAVILQDGSLALGDGSLGDVHVVVRAKMLDEVIAAREAILCLARARRHRTVGQDREVDAGLVSLDVGDSRERFAALAAGELPCGSGHDRVSLQDISNGRFGLLVQLAGTRVRPASRRHRHHQVRYDGRLVRRREGEHLLPVAGAGDGNSVGRRLRGLPEFHPDIVQVRRHVHGHRRSQIVKRLGWGETGAHAGARGRRVQVGVVLRVEIEVVAGEAAVATDGERHRAIAIVRVRVLHGEALLDEERFLQHGGQAGSDPLVQRCGATYHGENSECVVGVASRDQLHARFEWWRGELSVSERVQVVVCVCV
jgi:hypothetical protein